MSGFLQLKLDSTANSVWQSFKLNKLKDDSGKPIQWITLKFDNAKEPTCIQIDQSGSGDFAQFKNSLPELDSRYGIYNLTYKKGDGDRQKVALLVWAPGTSPVKARMMIASNKDSIKNQLHGIHIEFQEGKHSDLDVNQWIEQAQTNLK